MAEIFIKIRKQKHEKQTLLNSILVWVDFKTGQPGLKRCHFPCFWVLSSTFANSSSFSAMVILSRSLCIKKVKNQKNVTNN